MELLMIWLIKEFPCNNVKKISMIRWLPQVGKWAQHVCGTCSAVKVTQWSNFICVSLKIFIVWKLRSFSPKKHYVVLPLSMSLIPTTAPKSDRPRVHYFPLPETLLPKRESSKPLVLNSGYLDFVLVLGLVYITSLSSRLLITKSSLLLIHL